MLDIITVLICAVLVLEIMNILGILLLMRMCRPSEPKYPPQFSQQVPMPMHRQVVEQPLPPPPMPQAAEPKQKIKKFICNICKKEFPDEKKLRRHFGMAHWQSISLSQE